jgi:hypothetical protein
MDEHIRLQLPEEEERERLRVERANGSGGNRASEVLAEDPDRAPGRDLLCLRIEGNDDRGRMHLHRNRGPDDRCEKRHHSSREVAEHHSGIGRRIEVCKRGNEFRHDDRARAHGGVEQSLFRFEVAKDRCRRHFEDRGDIGQRRSCETASRECDACRIENLVAGNAWRAAHL